MKLELKRKKMIVYIVTVFVGLFIFLVWQNNSIIINKIVFSNDNIAKEFNGYKILQISDIHNKEFGSKQNTILTKIKHTNPDIIVVTGDLIDSNNTNIDIAMDLIKQSIKIAPIFYVSGNHDDWSGVYDNLKYQ